MKNSITPVVKAVIKKEGKYLLTKRFDHDHSDPKHHEFWHLPGGGLEWQELVEDALKREMKEELGIDIEIIGLIPKIFESVKHDHHMIFIYFMCQMKNENDTIVLDQEASDYNWFSAEQIKDLHSFNQTNAVIELAEKIT